MSKRDERATTPMWSGTIAYGAIRVPVRMWRAQPTEKPAVQLKTLHRECMAPINRVDRCSECALELRPEDKMSAYEVARGEYVPVAREDLPRPEAEEKNTIEVADWIPVAQIDPLQFDRTYYLAPSEGTERAYALLHRAMLQTETAMVARVTLRTRESLCAVYPRGGHLVMTILHIASELTDVEVIPAGADGVAVHERDFDELCSTIARRTVRWNPYAYKDRQTEDAMKVIRERIDAHAGITRLHVPRDRRIKGKVA